MPYSHPQPLDSATIYHDWKHILPGAIALTLMAGYVNSVVLNFFQTPVSHMSGAVSHLGNDLAQRHMTASLNSMLIVLGFLLGATIAGALVGARNLLPSRRYGVVLMLEGVLLALSTVLLTQKSPFGPPFAAVACGLQNAMSSSYCGLMIRTTHVSGVVTDLGVMLGHWLRHRQIVVWKLIFLLSLLAAFAIGGCLGAALDILYGPRCLITAAFSCLLAGTIFFFTMQHRRGEEKDGPLLPRTSIFPEEW